MKNKHLLATNPKHEPRHNEDFYATDPRALEIFLDAIDKDGIYLPRNIWECAVGKGHLVEVLCKRGYFVDTSDIVDRGYDGIMVRDFLLETEKFDGTILTNPPFKLASQFVEKGMELLTEGNKLILFLKVQFLESITRKPLFKKYPPKYVYVNSERQHTAKDGNFEKYGMSIGTLCYCWYIWEKGFTGEPTLRWI